MRVWAGQVEAENVSLRQARAELHQRIADLESRLLEAREEAERARADVDYWKEEFFELQKVRTAPSSSEFIPEPAPTRVAEALARVEQAHPERISIKLNSVSDKASPFLDAEAVYKALVFLATTYVAARSGRHPCQDLDAACREASGFLYKPGQSPVTVGRYRHDYETTWQGQRVPLEEHLAKGTGRDPRHAIRVGFFFDRRQNRVVVGYIGQHQTTTET